MYSHSNIYKIYKKATDINSYIPAYKKFKEETAWSYGYPSKTEESKATLSEVLSPLLHTAAFTGIGAVVGALSGSNKDMSIRNAILGGAAGFGASLLAIGIGSTMGHGRNPMSRKEQKEYADGKYLMNYAIPGLGAYNIARNRKPVYYVLSNN